MAGTSHSAYIADGRDQIGMVSDLRQAYAQLSEQQLRDIEQVRRAQDRLNDEVKEGAGEAKKAAGAFGGVAESLSAMKGQLLAVAAAAAGVTKAVKFVGDETARLDRIAKGAQQTGLGFDAYQRLSHVATLSGTSIEALSKGTIQLNRRLNELAAGRGAVVADNLERLGLGLEDLDGVAPTEQLAIIADAINGLDSEVQRTAIAVEIFGRSGADLVPLFNAGAEGVRTMTEQVGRVFTREELARAEAYQDSLANLGKAASDVGGQLAVALAPVLQSVADDMSAAAADFGESEQLAEGLAFAVDRLGAAIEPVVGYVSAWASQLEILGNVVNLVGDELGDASDAVGEYAGEVRERLADTRAAEWAREAADAAGLFADDGIGRLTDRIEQQLPVVAELRGEYEVLRNTILSTNDAVGALGFGKAQTALGDLLSKGKQVAKQQTEIAAQVAVAEEDSQKRGGGGPSRAEQLQAEGEAQLAVWSDRIALIEAEAQLRGTVDETAVELGRVRHNLAIQELELERQVLEATRARNSVERERNNARIEAIGREQQILDVRQRVADREAELALISEAMGAQRDAAAAEIQDLERLIELERARGVETGLLEEQRRQAEIEFAETFGSREDVAQAQHQAELERIRERMDAQAAADAWDAELNERQRQRTAERVAQEAAAIGMANRSLRQGQQLASTIIDAAIKDDEKRQRAALRAQGIESIGIGILETVKAASAFAGFNYVQGALHTAAAATAYIQGGRLLAGDVSGGGAGASSPPTAGGFGGGGRQRNTSAAATTPESVPAADQQPATAGGAGPTQQGGTVVIQIENVNGNFDEDLGEKIGISIGNAAFAREAVGA